MKKLIGTILISLVASHSAYAFNLSFLDYSPVYYFTKSDWAIAESTALKALNKNIKLNWHNPETQASGYFVPLQTFTKNGTTCRRMKTVSQAHQYTGQSVYVFCKINGEWKIAS